MLWVFGIGIGDIVNMQLFFILQHTSPNAQTRAQLGNIKPHVPQHEYTRYDINYLAYFLKAWLSLSPFPPWALSVQGNNLHSTRAR